MGLDPSRTVEELRELQALTGDEDGAQRVAWTDTWEKAREFLCAAVAETGAAEEVDEAGNQWFTLRGASDRALLIGGHKDSLPNRGRVHGRPHTIARRAGLARGPPPGAPPPALPALPPGPRGGARLRGAPFLGAG